MLSSNTRRTVPANNQKPELPSLSSDFPLIAPADDYPWHPANADWDISQGMINMRIGGDDLHAKTRTPSKQTKHSGQEESPLETSSNASLDSSSPSDQHLGLPAHSRGSSSDTSLSSHGSSSSRTMQPSQYSVDKDSDQWPGRDQPTYPSLSGRDQDFQIDYNAARQGPQSASAFLSGRGSNSVGGFRQPPPARTFNAQVQSVVPNASSFPYNSAAGNGQQLYDMMMPGSQDPAVAHAQPQSFRGGHQHSASDPANLRDNAALQQLLAAGLQPFSAPGMYPGALAQPALSMFANQFYSPDTYPGNDLTAQLMAARLQSQYASYGLGPQSLSPSAVNPAAAAAAALAAANGNGPSANNRKLGLYKTELCRSWEEKGTCRYGNKCQFAHGEEELRKVPRHPKYKTEICRTFWVSGSCPYGKRCCFIHTELPANGAAPGSDGTPPPVPNNVGRDRSASTNSDPNDTSGSSLLARITAKRNQDVSSGPVSTSSTPPSASYSRPSTTSLRIDTSVLDAASNSKQNKSAYPTLANGMLIQTNVPAPIMTHGPVTAGPDFGRHAAARLDIVGHNNQRKHHSRGSFNGSDNGMEPSPVGEQIPRTASRGSTGHVRSGSAGNWNVSRSSNLANSYPLTSGPDVKPVAPWLNDNGVNVHRIGSEQNWN